MSLDKIQEIFVNSGVEINDALATGKLTNVKVNDKTSTWRLCLQFSEIVEPDDFSVSFWNRFPKSIYGGLAAVFGS